MVQPPAVRLVAIEEIGLKNIDNPPVLQGFRAEQDHRMAVAQAPEIGGDRLK